MAVKPDDTRLTSRRPRLSVVEDGARTQPRQDARLVAALQAERPEAFDELVVSYQNAVFNLAYRLVRDREEARDVAQDVFLKAYKRIPQMEGDLHLWAWLHRVTVNTCWDHLRAAGRRPVPAEDAEELAGAVQGDEGERRELARLFSDSLARLSPRQQAALVLKDVHGLTHNDIADTLGISRASSEILLFRARHSFRRAYSALVAEEQEAHVCRYAERSAAAAVGGRLSLSQRRRVLEHAQTCERCRDVVAAWRRGSHAGLALALPFVAAPHLFGAHAGLTAAGGAGLAGAETGAAAGSGAAGGGAAASTAAAASSSGAASVAAPLLGAGATSGAAFGTAGAAAKLAGLGVAKVAAVVLVATSVAAYGGAQAGRLAGAAPAQPVPVVASAAPPAAHTPVPVPSPSGEAAREASAPGAQTVDVESLRGRLCLLRRAAVLTGDPSLAAQVQQLGLLLAAGAPVGPDVLRAWNTTAREAMRMLRAIGGGGRGRGDHRTQSLAVLVKGAQARLAMASLQGSGSRKGSNAAAAGAEAVSRASSGGAGGSSKLGAGSTGGAPDEAPPSAVDPSAELGGMRDATPDVEGGSSTSPSGELPSVKKPVSPVAPAGSGGKPQGGTAAQ